MNAPNQDTVHSPPRPARIVYYLAGTVVFMIAWGIFGPAYGNDLTPILSATKRTVISAGILPGLLAWQIYGKTRYHSMPASSFAFPEDLSLYPASERFRLLGAPQLSLAAILERATGTGNASVDDGPMLCLRYREALRWLHPMMFFHYLGTALLAWRLPGGSYDLFLFLPLSWLLMFISFMWLCLGGPWCVLYFRQNVCRFEPRYMFYTGSADTPRVVRAVPDGAGLRLSLEGGKKVKVQFPEGSLSPATQQAIALDLLRGNGVPTVEEDNPAAGVYR